MLWLFGFCILFVALIPYIIYFFGIFLGRKSVPVTTERPPPEISLIIAAYNEASIIIKRIENIAASSYPKDCVEVILVDDCSQDDTAKLAAVALDKTGFEYRIIHNTERSGTNRSYNRAIPIAKSNIIVTTDADVFFAPDTLGILMSRLCSDDRIAAACADLRPREDQCRTVAFESVYRNFYGKMCDWESTVDSTYTFNGALVAFKKDLVHRIEERKGADDANTAFAAIRNGYRAVYEIHSVVYEILPGDVSGQFRQKTRRAKRLIEATISNLDLLRLNRPFSQVFYPLRIFMYIFTPVLYLGGLTLFFAGIFLANTIAFLLLLVSGVFLFVVWKKNLVSAFTINQIYLLSGLLHLGKNTLTWESTSQKKVSP